MSTKTTKADVNEIITERIIAMLEAGTAPWLKPWRVSAGDILPTNFKSKKAYRGINVFLLSCSGFDCPYYVTFKQAGELGGTIKKGSHGFPVVFWNWRDKKDSAGNTVRRGDGKAEQMPFLRYYTVFNLEQTEGIEWTKPATVEGTKWEPLANCEAVVNGMPKAPPIRIGGGSAYYSPGLDYVQMPAPETFADFSGYYGTLFHELVHSTGHESRLCRKGIARSLPDAIAAFGSASYSREELVAEMGAAFLCGHTGILNRTVTNTAAYLASWIKALKGDSKLVVTAAAQAQKAADFILNSQPDTGEETAA